jgi:anti-sigma factor RsiW
MNHPDPDTLMALLYDELDAEQRTSIEAHLRECDACAQQLNQWRGVQQELKGWTLPERTRLAPVGQSQFAGTALRWAAAAAIFVGAGFALAKLTETPIDTQALHAEIVNDVRQQVRHELTTELASYSAKQSVRQQDFQQSIIQVIGRLEARQIAQHASLRKDVETVALHTQEELNRLVAFDDSGGGTSIER